MKRELESIDEPIRKNILNIGRKSLVYLRDEDFKEKELLQNWLKDYKALQQPKFSSHLYSELDDKATNIEEVEAEYDDIVEGVYVEPVNRILIETIHKGAERVDDKGVADVDVDAEVKFDDLFDFVLLGLFLSSSLQSPLLPMLSRSSMPGRQLQHCRTRRRTYCAS